MDKTAPPAPAALLEHLHNLLGADGLHPQPTADQLIEPRGLFSGKPIAVAYPDTSEQVVAIVRACAAAGVSIVPQGGNTGLTGASMPITEKHSLLVNLRRLNQIRTIDAADNSLVAEAGVIVADLQQHAANANRLFPLSFAADGSAMIGGAVSTNAGGTNVLRYGNTRELVRGLEVVLPNGDLLDNLRGLRKDNTGYDLNHLFIGAEGTLGIITAARLKLFPQPGKRVTAWLGVATIAAAVELLERLQQRSNHAVSGCELLSATSVEFVRRHLPQARPPLQGDKEPAWQLLIELTDPDPQRPLDTLLENTLADALQQQLISDAVIAQNLQQGEQFWRIREAISDVQKQEGGSIKHDISLPIGQLAEFVQTTLPLLHQRLPGVRPCIFGHLGDGNLHFNLSQPVDMDQQAFLDLWVDFNRLVHDQVARYGGSFSAEHGIGQLKREELARYQSPVALQLMRQIKRALDPDNLMNPGKLLPD